VREVWLIFPAASEVITIQPQSQPRPGILIVNLYEGVGFYVPDQYKQGSYSFSKYLPYALLDFDESHVFSNSVSGTRGNPLWAGDNTSYKFDVSRVAELAVYLYLRNPNATRGSGRSQDIFLGLTRINPRFEESHIYVEDPKLSKKHSEKTVAEDNEKQTPGESSTEWLDIQHGTGKIRIGVQYIENKTRSLKVADFELLKVVRHGSLGKVMQVRKKDTQRIYAIRMIRKAHIISWSETLAERSVLSHINNPFIVPLKFAFQSPEELYFVSAFVNGGELFYHLQKEQRFDINSSRLYTAELLCALECLHGFNLIYRDLKPKNILLDYSGHIALCDFGLYKLDIKDKYQTNTLSRIYQAPELLLSQGYTNTVDWWTLGILLYEMLTGLPPFYNENSNEIYRKILSEPLYFPDVVPLTAKDILTKLLNRKPEQRLGANGASEIKAHPFFQSIDWRKLLQREYEPPFKPKNPDDGQILSETMLNNPNDSQMLSETTLKVFRGWSCNRTVRELGDGGGSLKDPSFDSVQDNPATDNVVSVTVEKPLGNNIESGSNIESGNNMESETNTSEKDWTLAEDHGGSSALPGKDATTE
jgi:serum/glucocorticoid-regulated kinase 2